MSAPRRVVYLHGPEDDERSEAAMKFRLTYEGELRPTGNDPYGTQKDPLAPHKQNIRRVFHGQLKQLWATNRFLSECQVYPSDYGLAPTVPPPNLSVIGGPHPNDRIPLVEAVAQLYQEFGYRFVPLVRVARNPISTP